jgi:hypothetical protein
MTQKNYELEKPNILQSFSSSYAKSEVFRIFVFLISINLLFVLLHVIFANSESQDLKMLFHLDAERNLPALYSAIMLAAAGFAAFDNINLKTDTNRISRRQYRFAWGLAGVALLFMGLDEYFSIHESSDALVSRFKAAFPGLMEINGFAWGFKWAFFVSSIIIVALVGVPCLIFFYRILNKKLFYLAICAGFIYISGAVLIESLQHLVTIQFKDLNMLLLAEEFSEMSGVSLILFVFLSYRSQIAGEAGS